MASEKKISATCGYCSREIARRGGGRFRVHRLLSGVVCKGSGLTREEGLRAWEGEAWERKQVLEKIL